MKKQILVHLYKNSDCDLCKMMLHELIDNPPCCDVIISHYKQTDTVDKKTGIIYSPQPPCKRFPTIVIMYGVEEIARLEGFVSSEIITKYIKDYEREAVM